MLIGAFAQYFYGISIFICSIFLILLVLVQRGRGGGLTGALGGPGGQSAFGTKAGDLFTRITIGVATAWIFLCASSVYFLRERGKPILTGGAANTSATSEMGGIETDSPIDSSSGVTGEIDLGGSELDSSALNPGITEGETEVTNDPNTDQSETTDIDALLEGAAETTTDESDPNKQP